MMNKKIQLESEFNNHLEKISIKNMNISTKSIFRLLNQSKPSESKLTLCTID